MVDDVGTLARFRQDVKSMSTKRLKSLIGFYKLNNFKTRMGKENLSALRKELRKRVRK